MRAYLILFVCFLCGFTCAYSAEEGNHAAAWSPEMENADSIIKRVIAVSPSYAHIIDEYKADVYIRAEVKADRLNHLIKVVPSMFRFQKGVKEYVVESDNDLHYTAPDIYDFKKRALTGTFGGSRNGGEIFGAEEFFRTNPYSTSLLPERLLSPLSESGMKRYYYLLDSVWDVRGEVKYKILIVPRFKSHQLINGYMIVSHGSWTIDELYATGRLEQMRFRSKVIMGKSLNTRYLPEKMELQLRFKFVGNKLTTRYEATFNYKQIVFNETARKSRVKRDAYDLSDSYLYSTDSTRAIQDTNYMAKIRPYPLTDKQQELYRQYRLRVDTVQLAPRKGSSFWGQVGDAIISDYTVRLGDVGSIKCSPIINPLMIGYSHNTGYSYMQKFKYNYVFSNHKLIRVMPRIGYNFTEKKFYWRVETEYLYWPEHQGMFHLRIGNGNRIYSSLVQQQVKELPDSLQNRIPSDIDYFRDYQVAFDHRVEILNGLTLRAGISYHRRTLANKDQWSALQWMAIRRSRFLDKYVSFAPRIRVEWTPRLYYYRDGRLKKNLYSYYPTFSVDWERGLKGVFHSTGHYERLEWDMQQKIDLGALRSFFYRVGCGAYTNQQDMYFVDYANFSRNNLPSGWNDEIGGSFQLLDRYWYNSSDKYIRGHVTYETPFLIVRHFTRNTSIVQTERLYGSVLYVPHLLPYIELGYGVGTHIFDFGFFASTIKGKFDTVGCKFTFELFNR